MDSPIIEELEEYTIFELDTEGKIISWNENAEKTKGYSQKDVIGKHYSIFFVEEDIKNNIPEQLLAEARQEGKVISEGWRYIKDKTKHRIKSIIKARYDEKNQLSGFYKISRDLSDQHLLKNSNDRNKIFVNQVPHAMAMFDKNMVYLAASEKWKEDYNLSEKDIIGKSHYEIFPEIGDEWKKIHQDCIKGHINICDEAQFVRADGTTQWIKWDVRPWYFSENEIGGILMYTADITEKKKMMEDLRINEQQFRGSFENSPIGMALVSLKGEWMEVNKELCDMLGYTEEELLNTRFQDITHKEDLEKDLTEVTRTINGEIDSYKMEKRYIHKNGSIIWAMLSVSLVRDEKNNPVHFVSMIEDITERKENEQDLLKLNSELNAVLNSTHAIIVGTDTTGKITHFNKGAELMLGYTANEVIEKNTPAMFHKKSELISRGKELSLIYGEDVSGFDIFVKRVKKGVLESNEWTLVKKDGSEFSVQLVVTGIYNEKGDLYGFIGVATDITALKNSHMELEKSKNVLETLANKLTVQNKQLLEFAHITSHNLRSPVSNLQALIDIYKTSEDSETKEMAFENFEESVSNLSSTLEQLMNSLKVQREASKNVKKIDIEASVDKTLKSIKSEIKRCNATITKDFDGFKALNYNDIYFESIILNLVSNAIRYKSPDRDPEIIIKTEIIDGKKVLSVEDNGIGIDLRKHGHKLFGLYKTFHRHKDARGVGLFITKTQIESMGGKIYVKSNVGKGSIFYIEL